MMPPETRRPYIAAITAARNLMMPLVVAIPPQHLVPDQASGLITSRFIAANTFPRFPVIEEASAKARTRPDISSASMLI